MFQTLLAHLQEAFHKWYLANCMRVMLVGFTRIEILESNHGAAN
jgi:hypothetical protein